MKTDISDRADLEKLIETFYGLAFADGSIGPFFTQVAHVTPETHFPLLADFWETVLFGKNLLRVLLGEQLQLPDAVWQRLNWAWVAFFGAMGVLNLWVAYTFSTDAWVNFKLFGGIGLMLVFTLAQGLYLSRYLPDDAAATKEPQ